MGAQEWEKICKKVKDIEEEYAKSDHVVDLLTEQFIIRVDDSSEDDDSDDGYEDDDDDNCDRGSPEPGPSTSKRRCTISCRGSTTGPCGDFIEGVKPLTDSESE